MNIGGHGRHRRHCAPVGCSPSGRPGPKSAGCCRLTTSVGWTPALESPFGYSPLCSKGPRGRPREAARDGKFCGGGGAISSNRRRRYHGRTAEASTLPSMSSVASPSSGNRTRARSPPRACRPPMQLAPPPQQR